MFAKLKPLKLFGGNDFNQIFSRLVVCCLALIVILILLVTVKGPHIRDVSFNPELPTQYSGEWLVLRANQPLKPVHPSQVSISPATPVSVLSSGSEVAVQLQRRLPYDTMYKLNVASPPVKLNYSFATPQGDCYYLISPGTVKKHVLFQSNDQTLYSAPFINQFTLTGNYMAVVDQDGSTDKLVIVNTHNDDTVVAHLPQAGTIQNLKASPDGNEFSFTFTSLNSSAKPYYNTTLFSYNVATNTSTPVYGFNHKSLKVSDWTYSPDGSVVVVQTFSSVIEAVYLNGSNQPLPLGAYGIISGFSFDGANIYVGTLEKGMDEINVTSRKVTRLNEFPFGSNSNLLAVYPLQNSNGYIELVQKSIPNEANLGQYVILVQPNGSRILYESSDGSLAVSGVSVSPNDQYISIGETPTEFVKYNNSITSNTLIVSVKNSKVVDRIPSLEQVDWQ